MQIFTIKYLRSSSNVNASYLHMFLRFSEENWVIVSHWEKDLKFNLSFDIYAKQNAESFAIRCIVEAYFDPFSWVLILCSMPEMCTIRRHFIRRCFTTMAQYLIAVVSIFNEIITIPSSVKSARFCAA